VRKVDRVHDGDTFIAEIADVHPLIGKEISIRIKGIDTPEITEKRQDIKALALKAREYVAHRLQQGSVVELCNVQRDKYFRILADVRVDGIDLGSELIQSGLAKPYDGKTKPTW
jgi:endonuclease YncB( thermonuclease family)